jgi:hypothetical protein
MRRIISAFFLAAAFWSAPAMAQVCPGGSTCNSFEASIYGQSAATPPYPSTLRVPAIPSATPGSTAYIAANLFTTYWRSQYGSAAVTFLTTDHYVTTCNSSNTACSTGTWSSPATWTLQAHTAIPDGDILVIDDNSGVLTNTNTLLIAPGGSDTINGSSSPYMLASARAVAVCRLDAGTTNWSCNGSITNGPSGSLMLGQGASSPGAFVATSGDWSINSLGAALNSAVHGVAYPASPAINTVPVVTTGGGSPAITYEKLPNAALSSFIIPISVGWIAGQNPNGATVATLNQAGTISSIIGTVETADGVAATVTVNSAPSGTACASGTAVSTSFDANGTAATNQTITNGLPSIAVGTRLCLVTTGTWAGQAAVGGITINFNPS